MFSEFFFIYVLVLIVIFRTSYHILYWPFPLILQLHSGFYVEIPGKAWFNKKIFLVKYTHSLNNYLTITSWTQRKGWESSILFPILNIIQGTYQGRRKRKEKKHRANISLNSYESYFNYHVWIELPHLCPCINESETTYWFQNIQCDLLFLTTNTLNYNIINTSECDIQRSSSGKLPSALHPWRSSFSFLTRVP